MTLSYRNTDGGKKETLTVIATEEEIETRYEITVENIEDG